MNPKWQIAAFYLESWIFVWLMSTRSIAIRQGLSVLHDARGDLLLTHTTPFYTVLDRLFLLAALAALDQAVRAFSWSITTSSRAKKIQSAICVVKQQRRSSVGIGRGVACVVGRRMARQQSFSFLIFPLSRIFPLEMSPLWFAIGNAAIAKTPRRRRIKERVTRQSW